MGIIGAKRKEENMKKLVTPILMILCAAIFIGAMILSKILITWLSKIQIPLITKVDKTLGLVLGIVLGLIATSLLATVIYTVLEVSAVVSAQPEVMASFNSSYVFRFIYNLRIFEFIRNFF